MFIYNPSFFSQLILNNQKQERKTTQNDCQFYLFFRNFDDRQVKIVLILKKKHFDVRGCECYEKKYDFFGYCATSLVDKIVRLKINSSLGAFSSPAPLPLSLNC